MTPAEFKTAHEALGVTTEFLATRCGVVVGRIWAYEKPTRSAPVPEHAAEVMRDLLADFECAAERLSGEAEGAETESLHRFVDVDRFHAEVPELNGWGALAQGLLLAEVSRRVPDVSIEYVA